MKILLLSRYEWLGASSRYRSYQYIPHLQSLGHEVTIAPLLSDNYLRRIYARQSIPVFDVLRSYGHRIRYLHDANSYDVLWIEYEALPWFPFALEHWIRPRSTPYVVDYDDAVFHRYDMHKSAIVRSILGRKIDSVMRDAAVVIAGNAYLAQRAEDAGARKIEIIPTVIDLSRYPGQPPTDHHPFRIGWIGSPSTSRFLPLIEPALHAVCRGTDTQVVTIGDTNLRLAGIPLESKAWDEQTEIEQISRFDVGIMPLPDSPWERGKCGLKLVKYMGCARPVVASPVGINRSLVEDGVNGFLADGTAQWVDALNRLREDFVLRRGMGLAGRRKIEKHYSLLSTAPLLGSILEQSRKSG